MLAYQLPPVFLGSQATTHRRKLILGEWNDLPFLSRNEAWLGAASYGAGKSNAFTHNSAPQSPLFGDRFDSHKEKPRRGYTRAPPVLSQGPVTREGKSRHISWLNTVTVKVNA